MSQFSVDVKKWAEKTGRNVEKAIKGTAIQLFRDVIYDTPVDTGRLRANWFCTLNSRSNRVVQNESDIYPDDNAILGRMYSKIQKGKATSTFYLTNNLPYVYPIEFEGYSKVKAPQGMVRKNVIRFNQIFENEIRKAK